MFGFLLIAFMYFFGVAAEVNVGFGPPKSIVSVFKQTNLSDLLHPRARLAFHAWVFVGSLAAVVMYALAELRRRRVLLSLLYLFAPLLMGVFWFDWTGWESLAGWGYVTVMAPFWTISAIAGRQDGQFYAEGFLAATAVGWWSLMWILVILREIYLCLPYDRMSQTAISPGLLAILNARRRSKQVRINGA